MIVEPAFITSHDFHAWLAQSWEYNDDGTEMTLVITEGANWNDGTPLDDGRLAVHAAIQPGKRR